MFLLALTSCSTIVIERDENYENFESEIAVVHISDLHINNDRSIYHNLSEIINDLKPDLLFITGDTVVSSDGLKLLDVFLKKIEPSISKYAVLGNWENLCGISLTDLKEVYEKNKIDLLVNEGRTVEIKGEVVYIYGTDDHISGTPDISAMEVKEDSLNLILTHSPGYFDKLCSVYDGSFYAFSGHTHGGQITFFGKHLYTPNGSGSYVKGIYIKEKAKLYVSKGIGNSTIGFRFFAVPDVFYVTFK